MDRRIPGGRTLVGPLLTAGQFARRIGVTARWLTTQPYLLRVDGRTSAGPAFPAFHLEGSDLRLDVCFAALLARRRVLDLEACDWMVRPIHSLGPASPLLWLERDGPLRALVDVLPEPPGGIPERRVSVDLEETRRAWLEFRDAGPTPGWSLDWTIARGSAEAYPAGV